MEERRKSYQICSKFLILKIKQKKFYVLKCCTQILVKEKRTKILEEQWEKLLKSQKWNKYDGKIEAAKKWITKRLSTWKNPILSLKIITDLKGIFSILFFRHFCGSNQSWRTLWTVKGTRFGFYWIFGENFVGIKEKKINSSQNLLIFLNFWLENWQVWSALNPIRRGDLKMKSKTEKSINLGQIKTLCQQIIFFKHLHLPIHC